VTATLFVQEFLALGSFLATAYLWLVAV